MKYVLDSCVAIKWVSPEPDSDKAIAARDGGHDLLAPDIFRFEIGNVLSKAVRRKKLTADDAAKALQLIDDDIPALADSHDLFARAMAISVEVWCSIWDVAGVNSSSSSFLAAADDSDKLSKSQNG